MTLLPAGMKVHLAFGYTDMRKWMDGLALMVQEVLHQDPVLRSPVRLPRSQGQPDQGRILGRHRPVPVHQVRLRGRTDGARP